MGNLNHGLMSSNKDDWETPRDLFDRCDAIWHFDLDAASSDDNTLCENHFTAEQDALKMSWGGYSRIWVNPPYGREVAKFVEKAATESLKHRDVVIVMMLPARTDTRWWNDWIEPYATEIQFLRGRVRFCLDGIPQQSAPFPSVLVRFNGSLPKEARPHEGA